jgi:HK97 family phage major capsid protein
MRKIGLLDFDVLERRREIIQTALARSKAQRAAKEQRPSTLDERIRRVNDLTGTTFPAPKFASLAENIIAIVTAERGGPVDPRLVRASAGANINDPTAGGFLIEEQYSQELVALAYEESLIADLCDRRPTSKPLAAVKIPGIDETSRADGSRYGGVIAYWGDESKSTPTTLPRFKNIEFSARKIIALVFGTDELLADAPMFEAHVKRALRAEFGFKLDLSVVSGSGVGQPLGILNSPALITVPKETGQAVGTIVSENVNKMWKRLPAPSRYGAVWIANEDADEHLERLAGNPGTYIPAGVNGNKFPLLKGRPVVTVEQCPVVGTAGDLILADLDHYVIVDGGMKSAMSLHVRFDTDQALLRFVMRVDGKPSFTTPITPYNGSLTRSPFVCLGAR